MSDAYGVRFIGPEEMCPRCRGNRFRNWLRLYFASRVTIGLVCQLCGRKYARAEPTQIISMEGRNDVG